MTNRPVAHHLNQLHRYLKDLTIFITVIEETYREDANFQKQKEPTGLKPSNHYHPVNLNHNSDIYRSPPTFDEEVGLAGHILFGSLEGH